MTTLPVILALAMFDIRSLPGNNCYPALRRHAPELLVKHRYPVESDIGDYWGFYTEEYGETPFCASGDLNEDGVVDYLAILIARDQPSVRVVAMLSGGSGARSAHILFQSSPTDPPPDQFVVEIVPKGVYGHLCAYAFDDANAAPRVRLARPAARFWRRASGDTPALHYLLQWNDQQGKFIRRKACGEK